MKYLLLGLQRCFRFILVTDKRVSRMTRRWPRTCWQCQFFISELSASCACVSEKNKSHWHGTVVFVGASWSCDYITLFSFPPCWHVQRVFILPGPQLPRAPFFLCLSFLVELFVMSLAGNLAGTTIGSTDSGQDPLVAVTDQRWKESPIMIRSDGLRPQKARLCYIASTSLHLQVANLNARYFSDFHGDVMMSGYTAGTTRREQSPAMIWSSVSWRKLCRLSWERWWPLGHC
jgi:hypothetical protein